MPVSNEPIVRQTLQDWMIERADRKDLIWNEATKAQVAWVRNLFSYMVWNSLLTEPRDYPFEVRNSMVTVDGTHRSKSCELPVYCFDVVGVKFKIRGNFHDWCIKLFFKLQKPIPTYLATAILDRGCFEGMSHSEEGEQHRFCLNRQEQLYSFMWWALTDGKTQ